MYTKESDREKDRERESVCVCVREREIGSARSQYSQTERNREADRYTLD